MPIEGLYAGPADPSRINVEDKIELRHWSRELSKSVLQIKDAVKVAGPRVSDIRTYFQRLSLTRLR
jgi:hypothetical protein